MDKRRLTEREQAELRSDTRSGDKTAQPLDTDDNDEEFADAVGDSEDESEGENIAPEDWHEGEK